MNTSDEDFWNSLEDANESSDTTEEDSHFSLEEQLKMLSINETKAIEKLKMLQARKKKMKAQVTAVERKARNHRLFRLGETIEKILDRPATDEDIEKLELFLFETERQDKSFSKSMNVELNCNNNE